MITSTNTTSARNVQRNYRQVVEKVKASKQPVVVISRNQPEVAIVSIETLEEYERLKKINEGDWSFLDEVYASNVDKKPQEILKDITKDVEEVRQVMYEQKKAKSRR